MVYFSITHLVISPALHPSELSYSPKYIYSLVYKHIWIWLIFYFWNFVHHALFYLFSLLDKTVKILHENVAWNPRSSVWSWARLDVLSLGFLIGRNEDKSIYIHSCVSVCFSVAARPMQISWDKQPQQSVQALRDISEAIGDSGSSLKV